MQIIDDAAFTAGGHIGYNWQTPRDIVFGVEGDGDFLDGTDYLATVRGRLGYAFGPTLVYGTGGGAFIGFSDDVNGKNNDTGWVAGGGIEHKIRENLSVGVEGLYYGFDDNSNDNGGDNNFWTARARLTYHSTMALAAEIGGAILNCRRPALRRSGRAAVFPSVVPKAHRVPKALQRLSRSRRGAFCRGWYWPPCLKSMGTRNG